MKFTETFNQHGQKRCYYLGEDNKEYFFYHDRTGYTIRDMCKDDVDEWLWVMHGDEIKNLSRVEMALNRAMVRDKIEKAMMEDSMIKIMVIFNPANKLIGGITVAEGMGKPGKGTKGVGTIRLENPKIIKSKGSRVIEAIQRMNATEKMYDQMWLTNGESEIRIS